MGKKAACVSISGDRTGYRRRAAIWAGAVAVALALAAMTLHACVGSEIKIEAGPDAQAVTSTTAVPHIQTVGMSVNGRTIEVYAFGSGSWRVLIIGGVHGNEHGGPVARELVKYLEQHPEDVPGGVFLQIIPSANPDGEVAGTRSNARGVDINRNFPSQNWSSDLDPGAAPSKGLTGGISPGSEPETKAMLSVLDDGWDIVISLHSSGGIVDLDGEGGEAIAQRMSALSGFPVEGLSYQSYITGSMGVFLPERYQIPVITFELLSAELSDNIREALLSTLDGP